MSDLEMLLDTIKQTGELPEGFVPNTRIEHYLVHLLQRQGREGTPTPISRADVLLAAIDDEFAGGGGGGGGGGLQMTVGYFDQFSARANIGASVTIEGA